MKIPMSKLHILIIDPPTAAKIKATVRYAFEHPLTQRQLDALTTRRTGANVLEFKPPNEACVTVPPSTWCIFTVERHPNWARHLSIALDPRMHGPDAMIDVPAVNALLNEFEFEHTRIGEPGPNSPFLIHVHDTGQGHKSINIFEQVKVFPPYHAKVP